MPATAAIPTTQTVTPADQAGVAATVRDCAASRTTIFPLGGQTALGGGLATKQSGVGLSTAGLTRVIDYPARDMTITVEAGLTMAKLAETLAAENQFLPVDVAQSEAATVGGVMAANFSGPRRYGYGTMRDYVIGVSAVNGLGTPFKAGGRVVKNVAGYDFCKLLCGSLGTLAVITQVTLKVRPRPAASALVAFEIPNLEAAETLLAALTTTRTTPVAVELRVPCESPIEIIIGYEGTPVEVEWLVAQLDREFAPLAAKPKQVLRDAETTHAWRLLTEFGAAADASSLVLKLNVRPSHVVEMAKLMGSLVPKASILAHAGSGILLVNCGDLRDDDDAMRTIKRQFDPHNLLNPGRFIF
jgi:glycolate oxidase FAD binding subunit